MLLFHPLTTITLILEEAVVFYFHPINHNEVIKYLLFSDEQKDFDLFQNPSETVTIMITYT